MVIKSAPHYLFFLFPWHFRLLFHRWFEVVFFFFAMRRKKTHFFFFHLTITFLRWLCVLALVQQLKNQFCSTGWMVMRCGLTNHKMFCRTLVWAITICSGFNLPFAHRKFDWNFSYSIVDCSLGAHKCCNSFCYCVDSLMNCIFCFERMPLFDSHCIYVLPTHNMFLMATYWLPTTNGIK